MKSRIFISLLLLGAVCVLFLTIPATNSQSAAVTTTTTIEQLPLGKCSETSIAFSAQAGTEITGTFGSDVSINFYVLSQQDFDAIQNPKCSLPTGANPLFIEMNSVAHENPYRSLPFPANGTYYFVFVYPNSGISQLSSGHATVELTFPLSITLLAASSTQSSSSSNVVATTTQSRTAASTTLSTTLSFGTIGVIGIVVATVLVVSVMLFMRRGKSQAAQKAVLKQETVKREMKSEAAQPRVISAGQSISTGYSDLDNVLAGGLPAGYAILIVSPPYDERDLLIKRIIESNLAVGSSIFFLSRDLSRTQDFASRYQTDFYLFTPQADKITTNSGNVFKIAGVQNLIDVNVTFAKTIETLPKAANQIIIIDLLTDVLLEHKALTTRKWLDDFIARRKSEGFTILGTLNPLLSAKEESQTIIDLFDGIIEIYEREFRERSCRFLMVKKMYGRKYIETELMLDKDKLY